MPGHPYYSGFDLVLHPERLDRPRRWAKPKMIFVNSMSDLFHKDIPPAFVDAVFDVMEETPCHVYQVLTKRSSLMRDYLRRRYAEAPGQATPAYLMRRLSRRPAGRREGPSSPGGPGGHPICLHGATNRAGGDQPCGDRLADRRRRERTWGAAHVRAMVTVNTGRLHMGRRPVLLQAMGWALGQRRRSAAGRDRTQRSPGVP